MKKIISFVFIILVSISMNAQKKVVKPITKKSPVKILVGKKKTYYNLPEKLDFPIDNKQKVTIYSRVRMDKNPIDYTLAYSFDNGKEIMYSVSKSKIDKHSAFTKKSLKKRVSKLFKKEIDVPKNAKILHLYLKSKNLVDVKVRSAKKGIKPIQKAKKIQILKGKTKRYYKLNSKVPTVIKINGKGKLIVYTRKRLTKKDTDKYSFSYQIDDSKIKKLKINKAKKSKKAVYKSLKTTKKPSVNHKIIIELGTGEHQITFSSTDHVDARFIFIKEK